MLETITSLDDYDRFLDVSGCEFSSLDLSSQEVGTIVRVETDDGGLYLYEVAGSEGWPEEHFPRAHVVRVRTNIPGAGPSDLGYRGVRFVTRNFLVGEAIRHVGDRGTSVTDSVKKIVVLSQPTGN